MHAFNMFIMSRENVNNYCKWLFDILFEVEKDLAIKNMMHFRLDIQAD